MGQENILAEGEVVDNTSQESYCGTARLVSISLRPYDCLAFDW